MAEQSPAHIYNRYTLIHKEDSSDSIYMYIHIVLSSICKSIYAMYTFMFIDNTCSSSSDLYVLALVQ